ncbi:endonuclease/exonuclease/phosphatase family protein [Lacinutrix sp. Bg11-31]|uniref:endonuclease/exonuclease/phosphatase family protein n=1 Tax=Lacinutrix sp. Bg11-31 TaxID=2057808 RepID=UPI000C30639B|nr:endonuclease/exonuclease/phosphatase family protein [Lacinutrix sp. Bg11-31]AUC81819.1 hypothetical protein CW733_06610 [Lacinutrix sp. Bg11-31]
MKSKIPLILFFIALSCNISYAQETFKAMFYNLLNFPLQEPVASRLNELEVVLTNYQPDLFMVCELNNISGANMILNRMQQNINANYAMANFVLNSSDDNIGNQNDLQNIIYYDNTKFSLESQNEVTTIYRDFNHYVLKLNTVNQDSNPILLNVIVAHLKASSGTDNAALRYQMAQDLTTYLDTFSSSEYVLFGGDFNFYTNSENGFQEFLDTSNNITFIDPANRIGSWHNNTNYIDVFTQSTRTTTALGGAAGGFDDRFDFILASENMQNNPELQFENGSYKVFGNNANTNCYNNAINSTNCEGTDYSFAIRNALHNFSDHLPVTLNITTTGNILSIDEFEENVTSFKILGTNIVKNQLKIKVNKKPTFANYVSIYNTIGQLIETIFITENEELNVNTTSYSNGMYYVALNGINVKPLKFIKVN